MLEKTEHGSQYRALPADIDTLKAKQNVRGLIRALKSEDQNVRNTAIEALGEYEHVPPE